VAVHCDEQHEAIIAIQRCEIIGDQSTDRSTRRIFVDQRGRALFEAELLECARRPMRVVHRVVQGGPRAVAIDANDRYYLATLGRSFLRGQPTSTEIAMRHDISMTSVEIGCFCVDAVSGGRIPWSTTEALATLSQIQTNFEIHTSSSI
jgi:hypothetical protein